MVVVPIRAVHSSYSKAAWSIGWGCLSARLPPPSGSKTITQVSATGAPAVGSNRVQRIHSAWARSALFARMNLLS